MWDVVPVQQEAAWLEAADPTEALGLERAWVGVRTVQDRVTAAELVGVTSFVAVHPNSRTSEELQAWGLTGAPSHSAVDARLRWARGRGWPTLGRRLTQF